MIHISTNGCLDIALHPITRWAYALIAMIQYILEDPPRRAIPNIRIPIDWKEG